MVRGVVGSTLLVLHLLVAPWLWDPCLLHCTCVDHHPFGNTLLVAFVSVGEPGLRKRAQGSQVRRAAETRPRAKDRWPPSVGECVKSSVA